MTVAFVKVSEDQKKMVKTNQVYFEISDFIDRLRITLSDPKACVATFGQMPYSSSFSVNAIYKTNEDPVTKIVTTTVLHNIPYDINNHFKLSAVKLKSVNLANQEAQVEVVLEKKENSGFGSKSIIREFKILAFDPGNTLKLTNCFTTGTVLNDASSLCATLGGSYDNLTRKCNGIVAVDPNPVFCSKFSKRKLIQNNVGLIKLECEPCTIVDKFDHWKCDHYPGKSSYSNLCYYRKVCQESTNDVVRPAIWNGLKGPIDAGGGDTGNHSNCVSKRKRCFGEPANMSENQVNP